MEGPKSFRDEKRTIRMNTNRREDLCMQRELEDVNIKTISDINAKRQLKKLEQPTEEGLYLRSMQARFIPEPPKRERKSQPVFHDDIKTKDMKQDQYLVMPTIPAYSPVDIGAKVVLESRSRKYPYVKKQLTTTEEMKKPRVSTLGVLPVRESLEIPDLRVVLEGDPAPVDTEVSHARPKLYNTPATSFFVPKLQLQEGSGDESAQKTKETVVVKTKREGADEEDVPLKKPAILPGVGTAAGVNFSERVKPAAKPSYLWSLRKKSGKSTMRDTSRADTAQSFQSSLMSGEITLPDETVYNQYDNAIDHINDDYDPDDVETVVGGPPKSRASVQSGEGSIKSVKELLDEAKRISRADSDPLYKQGEGETGKKVEMDTLAVTDRKTGRKSAKSTRSSKSAKSNKDGKTRDRKKSTFEVVEKKREERTVDEIIASLKDQSAYNIETEADRKIKEIMNRVISRSTAVLESNLNDNEDNQETAVTEDDAIEPSEGQDRLTTSDLEDEFQGQDSPRDGSVTDASDTFKQSMTDMTLPQDQIAEESEGEGLSMTTRTTETMAAVGDIAEDVFDRKNDGYDESDDEDEENILMPWDIQQAWEDLLSPPEASAEDILSVHGQMKDMHEKMIPVPDTNSKPNIHGPSLSFLSSWAPAGAKRDTPVVKKGKQFAPNNIHHFCKMTTEFQMPEELMHVGRKYHHPDKYASVMPQQPYRFKPGEPIFEERESSANTEVRVEQAAQRVITETNRVMDRDDLTDWQGKAERVLGELDMTLAGDAVQVKRDESQVYWNPAPPKLGAASFKVRELLFAQYNVEEVDEFGRVKAAVKVEEESESSEEEEAEMMSKDDLEAMHRTLLKRHNSAETLTLYSREKVKLSFPGATQDDDEIPETEADTMTYDVDMAELEGRDEQESLSVTVTETVTERGGAMEREGTLDTQANFEAEFQSQQVPKKKRETKQDRPGTAPNLIYDDDDTLIVPQDFNTAMHEISEQKRLLEKAKKQMRVQEAFDELEKLEQEEREKNEQTDPEPVPEVAEEEFIMEPVVSVEEELTPAEQALKAGRNYVILPKKKKKKKGGRPVDMARIEAVEKFLVSKPMVQLIRHESMPKLHRALERDLRVPWHIRTHRSSIPDLLNFDEYKQRKRIQRGEDEREWVRKIWNSWFDQVFPPTPDASDGEEEGETEGEEKEEKKEKKSKKETISDILSQDVEAIAPIMDTPENAEIYHILTEEIDKLTQVIDMKHNKNAFDYCRRGALLRKIGLLKRAEEDLDRAINMEPELLDAYWHRHLLYILQDRKSAALDDLNFIMKKNKNHAGAYRSMAEIYKRQGDITMAIINYSSAIKFNPLDHEAHYQRAGLYEERGEMLLAMEDYTKAMKVSPQRTDAIIKHGMYYFENENWQNAINDFTELLKVDPLNATGRLFRGRAYAKMNSWVPAVEDLSAAIHLDPYNWQAFYQRACILRKAHPKRALQDYSVSLLLNDTEENVMSYLHRGILYDTLGKPEDSIPDFESVLKLNKDIAAAHVNLGLIYMTKHLNYHRAIKKFSSAIKVDPTYVRAYVCRAEAYHKIHETKNALKDYTRAIHLKPDIHHFYMFRGQLVLELGNLDLAAFCVRHASELGMDSPTSTFGASPTQQAVVQSFLKNYDKAIDALVQASRVKPIAPYFMMLGKTNMKAKQFKDAVTSFKAALEKMRPWRKRDPWPPETADAHYLAGLCHMELRNYSEALQQFNFAIKFNPSHADAYYQRGLAAVKMRQMKGIQDFNRALALNSKIFQAYLSRACFYGMKGKYAKAILNCNEAIKLQPKSVRAFLYRGSLKYHIKAYELAILDLSKAAAIDTQCPLPFFNRAVCYHENGQYDKALTDYGIVLLLGSMLSLKVLINRGLLYFEKQDYMNALFDFQAAAKLSSKDHRIHHTLGLCFHKLNRLKEAVATFTHCLQLKPFFLDGIIARGNVFMDYGHARGLEFARRDYQRALRLDPLCLPARINLAYTAQVSGKLMQAWKHFTAVIEVRPNYKPALEGRAIINLQMSSTFAALQDISRSINWGATAELLTNRGVINQFMGDPVMAMQDYQRAIKLDPTYALAYFNAGNVYFHTRHFKQALEYYQKATQYNPQDESAFLNKAITKVLLHDTQGALADFKVAAKLSPYSAHIYFNRANLFASMQQFDKADKEYTKALELQPDDPLMLKRRADVRGKLGNHAEAIEDYKRAVHIQSRPNKVVKKS